jgi:MFS-type transporter involved in bile tolerance (Atg22 family)
MPSRLGRFNPLRTFGLLIYILAGVVAVPWAIGAAFAAEYMLRGTLLQVGIVAWAIFLFGIVLMRIANARERRRSAGYASSSSAHSSDSPSTR